jgi:hypothetical protein
MASAIMSHTFVDGFEIEAARSSILVERVVGAFPFVFRFVDIFCTYSAEKLVTDYTMT